MYEVPISIPYKFTIKIFVTGIRQSKYGLIRNQKHAEFLSVLDLNVEIRTHLRW